MMFSNPLSTPSCDDRVPSVLEAIGNTPLIRLEKASLDLNTEVWAKVEAFNPGASAKDRVAKYMIEQAERSGALKPGGTIIEATSGNTGYSLAMIAAVKGYHCVLTVTSKISQDKTNLLKAMGAEVVICPKDAKPTDPNSYYEKAKALAAEIPNSVYLNQNFNTDNMDAHYYSTAPEIWQQSEGMITHFVGSTGTGGTVSGIAKYLKEQKPEVQVIGVDAYGSVLTNYWKTGEYDPSLISSYRIEGTGKNIIPANLKRELIDHYEQVHDREAAFRTRELSEVEGLMMGYSSGANLQAVYQAAEAGMFSPNDFVVVIFHDHGSRYLGKVYSDAWMKEQGWM